MGIFQINLKLRLSLSILATSVLFFMAIPNVFAAYQDEYTITAYYSPLPDQQTYVTGSYNGDRRLNGNGTNGACGKQVYPGLIAAPSNFEFGVKIDIPGFGTGSVCDRGGAIKNKRLDIWLGFGDEGLKRALAWGKRTVPVTIYDSEESENMIEEVYFDLAQNASEYIDLILTAIAGSYNGFTTVTLKYFTENLGVLNQGEKVEFLQSALKDFGYLNEENITGVFDETTQKAIVSYQIGRDIIDSDYSFGAGFVGPQTRKILEKDLEDFKNGKYQKPINYLEELQKYDDLYEEPQYVLSQLEIGDSGEEVVWLQEQLQALGYLKLEEPSGYFGEVTAHALRKFQLKTGIIAGSDEEGAGVFGPLTKSYMNDLTDLRIQTKGMIAIRREEEDEKILAKINKEDKKSVTNLENIKGLTANFLNSEMDLGDNNENVKKLQEFLQQLGYFKGTFTSTFFGDNTREAVLAFQLDRGIISSEDDLGAGRVGPKTLEVLKNLES